MRFFNQRRSTTLRNANEKQARVSTVKGKQPYKVNNIKIIIGIISLINVKLSVENRSSPPAS